MRWTRAAGATMASLVTLATLPLACSSTGDVAVPSGPRDVSPRTGTNLDAGGDAAATPATVTVTTVTAASTSTLGGKTSATWAAFAEGDGPWQALAPSAAGTYRFEMHADRYSVAFVCADADNALVAVYERDAATSALEVQLESWCATTGRAVFDVAGTLSHVPTTTSWMNFAYSLEARGAVLPIIGTDAPYEMINVAAGTWTLAFGLRDASTSALSKVAFVRNQVINADVHLDVDMTTAAFVPEQRKLVIRGLDPASETLSAPVSYLPGATGGGGRSLRGLNLGPESLPALSVVESSYATIPASARAAGDRYRLELRASDGDNTKVRGLNRENVDGVDIDVSLPSALPAPVVTLAAGRPYVRLATRIASRPEATSYDVEATEKISNKSLRVWRSSSNRVGGDDITLTLPDLSSVAGFNPAWALPADLDRTVTATVHENVGALRDGTVDRFASHAVTIAVE